jgi:hypothetical protein
MPTGIGEPITLFVAVLYVSEDAETALAETVDQEGTYVVGEFVTERDALILDLAELPETPSIFYQVPDSMEYEYDDPLNCMGIDDGEFIGETFGSHELLYSIGPELPNDDDGKLFSAIARGLGDHLWCDSNPYGMSYNDELRYSWKEFCDTIKHRRRFFFEDQDDADRDLLKPSEVLHTIFEYCKNIGLVRAVPRASITLFRARPQRPGETVENVLQLGPPPREAARQNRMSPAGVVMMSLKRQLSI